MPKRIQRKRTRGWRKPEGAIIVDRTSKWGNPFKLEGDMIYCDASHRRKIFSSWVIFDNHSLWDKDKGLEQIIKLYGDWFGGNLPDENYINHEIVRPSTFDMDEIKRELKGKDLVCWCPLDKPCHADLLIEIANE